MRFAIATLGCKVNQYDSALIEARLVALGMERTEFNQPAEVYVINTCTITHRADAESLRLARRARKLNPAARVIMTGCLAQASITRPRRWPPDCARRPPISWANQNNANVAGPQRRQIMPADIMNDTPALSVMAPAATDGRAKSAHDWKEARTSQPFRSPVLRARAVELVEASRSVDAALYARALHHAGHASGDDRPVEGAIRPDGCGIDRRGVARHVGVRHGVAELAVADGDGRLPG